MRWDISQKKLNQHLPKNVSDLFEFDPFYCQKGIYSNLTQHAQVEFEIEFFISTCKISLAFLTQSSSYSLFKKNSSLLGSCLPQESIYWIQGSSVSKPNSKVVVFFVCFCVCFFFVFFQNFHFWQEKVKGI